jgi:hypothetical protein
MIFFQTISVSDVEFNEKFDKNPCFFIENLSYSNFGTKSLLLKRRIDWYIKLSFI